MTDFTLTEDFPNSEIEFDQHFRYTTSLNSYRPALNQGYHHIPIEPARQKDPKSGLYGVHLIASLVKRLIRGTFQGRLEPKYLQNYLDEYVFRFNRRKSRSIGKKSMRIVHQVQKSCNIRKRDIQYDLDPLSEYFSLGFRGSPRNHLTFLAKT